jgi:hypothetical protein
MADAAVWITGSGPDKQLNFRLPTGGIGPQGPAGPNTVPTDTAIANAVNNDASATKAALNATFVRFVDLAGNPISARHVTIKVDTSTWEIADIVAEA